MFDLYTVTLMKHRYWIVGITDQLVHNRISFNQYGSFISECPDEVMRLGKSFGGKEYLEEL